MKCPVCKKPTQEPGACLACLPFNMYFGVDTTPEDEDRCRRLMVANRNKLDTIPFSQMKIGVGGEHHPQVDGDDLVQFVLDDGITMTTALDLFARKSVLFGRQPTEAK